jgi:hypothetical protein
MADKLLKTVIVFCPHCHAVKPNGNFPGLCEKCGMFPATGHAVWEYCFNYIFGYQDKFETYRDARFPTLDVR